MQFDLEKAVEAIKNDKDFLKLKGIIEDNSGHDHEVEYDHCVRTYEVSRDLVKGDIITNPAAKEKFDAFLNAEIQGVRKRDILQLGALIHDIGKLVVFDENGKKITLGNKKPDGTFGLFPQHGYWGSKLVRVVTRDANLPEKVLDYLETFVDFHVVVADTWLAEETSSAADMLWKTKISTRGMHVDILLSMYCDFYYHPLFQKHKDNLIKILNMPEAYESLKFEVMS